jgi:multidrug efflux pump subunit AcrB
MRMWIVGAGWPRKPFEEIRRESDARWRRHASTVMATCEIMGHIYFPYSKPQIYVDINSDKVGELGLDMEDIATTLSAMLG